MQDKTPLAHYSGVLSEAVQESAAANLPTFGAAALSEYLKTCEQHAIVPDVGGAFASAFTAGFNLATSQAAQPAMTAALFAARGALQHLKEGGKPTESLLNEAIAAIDSVATSEAAPAAVAVPDEPTELFMTPAEIDAVSSAWIDPGQAVGLGAVREIVQAVLSRLEGRLQIRETAVRAMRAALAATPAADAPMVDMTPPATRRDRWMYEQGRLAERDARTPGSVAAAAPVMLPEPVGEVVLFGGTHKELSWRKGRLPKVGAKLFTEQQLHALLATATGLPAQAGVNRYCSAGMCVSSDKQHDPKCTAAPQAQADARDADDAELIKWLSDQYLAADFQWGDPKTPVLVIEIPPTASVCGDFRTDVRAAIAAAKGE